MTTGTRLLVVSVLALTVAVAAPRDSQAQITAPPKSPTLWSFLGIPQGVQKVHGAVKNRRGKHPKLEPKPPVKALADLANLESPVAAIKKAAEVKAAEDLKPQKVKAIRYLLSMGCGCYDKDGSITDALIAASEDPTPEVRLTVVREIHRAASGACCANCGTTCCCKEKMVKRLAEMAYLRDDAGCYVEPSAEIRREAARALAVCCPDDSPVIEIANDTDAVGPEPSNTNDYQGESSESDEYQGEDDDEGINDNQGEATENDSDEDAKDLIDLGVRSFLPRDLGLPSQHSPTPTSNSRWDGFLKHVDPSRGVAHVHLNDANTPIAVGTVLMAYGMVDGQERHVGNLRVYQSFAGSVNVEAVDELSKQAIIVGAAVINGRASTRVAGRTAPSPALRPAPASQAPTAARVHHGQRAQNVGHSVRRNQI